MRFDRLKIFHLLNFDFLNLDFRSLLLIALWFSVLFLPFAGFAASLMLFLAVTVMFFILKKGSTPMSVAIHRIKDMISPVLAVYPQLAMRRHSYASLSLLLLLLISFPFLAKDYFLDVAILGGIYIILALGLNVVIGFTGLLNLGFVAFYAIGAYAYALLNVKLGLNFWQSLPLCLGLTTLSGFILGVPALRLKGDYLAIVTLGFGEITRLILNNWNSFTGGPNGISGITAPSVLGVSMGRLNRYYYITLIAVALTYAVVSRIRSSRIGRAWIAIREDEIGASSMGINTTRYKLYAIAFGSLWAGLAGVLFAAKMQFVSPESFTFMESVLIVCMVILGGPGSIGGVIIGALVLVALPEVLREIQSYRMLALGAGLILMMVFRPQGLFGGSGGGK